MRFCPVPPFSIALQDPLLGDLADLVEVGPVTPRALTASRLWQLAQLLLEEPLALRLARR